MAPKVALKIGMLQLSSKKGQLYKGFPLFGPGILHTIDLVMRKRSNHSQGKCGGHFSACMSEPSRGNVAMDSSHFSPMCVLSPMFYQLGYKNEATAVPWSIEKTGWISRTECSPTEVVHSANTIWRCPKILLPQTREFSHNNQCWV